MVPMEVELMMRQRERGRRLGTIAAYAAIQCSLLAGWFSWTCAPAQALIVASQTGTTSPPVDDPGWDHVTKIGTNYTYLGDGWVLSARHVGIFTASFESGNFSPIPNQNFIVHNPIESGLTSETDLRLIRINGDPGLASIFGANAPFIISQSPVPYNFGNSEGVFVGHGRSRQANQTHWNVVKDGTNWTWNEVASACGGSNCYSGYKAATPDDDTKRWGKNRLTNANNYTSTFSQILPALPGETISTRGVLPLKTGDGIVRDVVSYATTFDQSGLVNEVQAISGDSGSAMFYKRNGQWELAGIVSAILTFEDQPSATAIYGDATAIIDLSYYRDEIFSIIDANRNYSIMGDINLDGVVSGNGTGPATSDDVAAFAAGWQYQQSVGDIASWTRGDLNRDGRTDRRDFFLLRSALQSTGSAAGAMSLSAALGGAAEGVPEPGAALLALLGLGLLPLGRSLRRRATIR
jgi:hypothetical protein